MAKSGPKLALGTAQWGLEYGIANKAGRPTREMLRQMVTLALRAGVDMFDTARAYGESESVIANVLSELHQSARVVTKLESDVCDSALSADEVTKRARASLDASCRALRAERVDTLLLHRATLRTCLDGAVWSWLRSERDRGRIGKLGISAATPNEAIDALQDRDVEVLQVPSSLLDQRLVRRGFFRSALEHGKEVHIRSIFLQGVAFLALDALPDHLEVARPQLQRIIEFEMDMGLHRGQAWLLYGRTLPVARLVLGTETAAQIKSNLEGFEIPIPAGIEELASQVALLSDDVLDPSHWPKL